MGRPRNDIRKLLETRVTVTTDCWLWTGTMSRTGYGRVSIGGREIGAHRAVYEALVGPVPDGMQLDHLCRVTQCVNPDHLEPVTIGENIRRGHSARGVTGGRQNKERRREAQRRYALRKRMGLSGPRPGESRAEYHARIPVSPGYHDRMVD